jgi:hypothetical protein
MKMIDWSFLDGNVNFRHEVAYKISPRFDAAISSNQSDASEAIPDSKSARKEGRARRRLVKPFTSFDLGDRRKEWNSESAQKQGSIQETLSPIPRVRVAKHFVVVNTFRHTSAIFGEASVKRRPRNSQAGAVQHRT